MKQGFTILELLVYISVFTLVMALSFHFITSSHLRFMQSAHRTNWIVSLHAAGKVLQHELEQTRPDRRSFKKMEAGELVMASKEGDIGFAVEKNKLVRIKGSYEGGRWRSRRATMLADHISRITFSCQGSGYIEAISWELIGEFDEKPYTTKQFVALRSKALRS